MVCSFRKDVIVIFYNDRLILSYIGQRARFLTFCCGAGGGSVWKEEKEGSRINYKRVDQLMAANPETIAVGCPFCMLMMDDAVKGKNLDEKVKVKDLVEIISESLENS